MDSPLAPVARLEVDLVRTVGRLRTLGLARLAASFEPEPTRADAAHALAQRLADRTADLEGHPGRRVPRLSDAAVGDQVAVCGHDLLEALSSCSDRQRASMVAASAADDLLDLRRRV